MCFLVILYSRRRTYGKSTLADRILEKTGAVAVRDLKEQLLDDLELERRRGITIKLNAVSINYRAKNGEDYSDDAIRALTEFQERCFESIIIRNK